MALSGVGGVPEPQKPQPAVSDNQSAENYAVSIFNSLNKHADNVIDEQDGIDISMLTALRNLIGGGKLTLKNLTKVADKLPGFTYTKKVGNDNIVYNIQGQAIRTSNTKFDAKGNVKSDKIEEYIFVKDADGNNLKVKINIDKEACTNNRAYESLMRQLVSEINVLSPQARNDLVNEVNGIKVKLAKFQGDPAGQFATGENIINLFSRSSNSGGYIMSQTIAHELGHAIDEHKGEFRLSQQINTEAIRKSLYSKVDFGKYSDEQRYFLFGGADEFAAEYYAYKNGGNPDNGRYALMREVEKSGDEKFAEATAACEQNWDNSRKNVEQQKIEKNLYEIDVLHKLKGPKFYRNEFFDIGEKLAPEGADEGLSNTQIIQQYYLYRMGKCDETNTKKFEDLKTSNDTNWATLEPLILKEFKRLGIEV